MLKFFICAYLETRRYLSKITHFRDFCVDRSLSDVTHDVINVSSRENYTEIYSPHEL